jgi:RHS repeat-associated protein
MQSNREMPLCHYLYDPLDRLTAYTLSEQASNQRYYLKNRLASVVKGAVQYSVMQFDDQPLAQQRRQNGAVETNVLATDQQRSVLAVLDSKKQANPLYYTPYGYHPSESGLLSLLCFNGEQPDSVTGHYLLGIGHHRPFNPVLMRFNCPDSWSPFWEGELNAYVYCGGDPVNQRDPTGHNSIWFKITNAISGRGNSRRQLTSQTASSSPVSTPTSTTSTTSAPSDVYKKGSMPGEPTRPATFDNRVQRTSQPTSSSPTQSAKELSSWPKAPPSEPGANQLRTPRQAPALIPVVNTVAGKMDTPYEVTSSKMQSIIFFGQSSPNLDPAQASKIIRELGGLPELGPGRQYRLPDVRKV